MTEPLHLPVRPSWLCAVDGEEWPCAAFKERLWRQHGHDVVAMSEAMVPWIKSARGDVVMSALQLHERFFGWIPRTVTKEIDE